MLTLQGSFTLCDRESEKRQHKRSIIDLLLEAKAEKSFYFLSFVLSSSLLSLRLSLDVNKNAFQ